MTEPRFIIDSEAEEPIEVLDHLPAQYRDLEDEHTRIVREAQELVINDDSSERAAISMLGSIEVFFERDKDTYNELIKPFKDQVKKIDTHHKDHIAPVKEADAIIRSKLADWYIEQDRRRDVAQAEYDREFNRQQEAYSRRVVDAADENITATPPPVPTIVPKHAKTTKVDDVSVTMVEDYDYDCIDEDKVPRDLCSPDIKKVRARHKSGVREIPGYRITRKINTRVRRNR